MASAAGSAGGSFADGSPGSSFSWRRSSSFRPSRIVLNSSGPSSPGRSVRGARGRNATPAQTSVMPIVISEMPRPVMRVTARKARASSSLRFELSALPGCGPERPQRLQSRVEVALWQILETNKTFALADPIVASLSLLHNRAHSALKSQSCNILKDGARPLHWQSLQHAKARGMGGTEYGNARIATAQLSLFARGTSVPTWNGGTLERWKGAAPGRSPARFPGYG